MPVEEQINLSMNNSLTQEDIISAHDDASYHRFEIEKSSSCGCFYCLRIFTPVEIKEWIDGDQTVLCPYCGIDSVIGSASKWDINHEFLQKMQHHWFAQHYLGINKKKSNNV